MKFKNSYPDPDDDRNLFFFNFYFKHRQVNDIFIWASKSENEIIYKLSYKRTSNKNSKLNVE